jgi:hypothetical protein
MRRLFIHAVICFLCSLPAAGQFVAKNAAYAFTYSKPGSLSGTSIKLVDLHTGEMIRSLYEEGQTYQIREAISRRIILNSVQVPQRDTLLLPMATSVAAAAYDEIHGRLFYTPLGINQLRYIDIEDGKTATFNYVTGQEFGVSKGAFDAPSQITRMVITPGGIGYALSNDGNHLLRFTTGQNTMITDLGELIDNPANTAASVHTLCSSSGGDMVYSVTGELVLVTAYNHIFSIDVHTKVATYQGMITGLPANFTSNGAAVDDDGALIVSCATESPSNGYFKVDMNGLTATRVSAAGPVIFAADLANGNVLGQPASAKHLLTGPSIPGRIFSVYPSPVTDGYLNMALTNFEKGSYDVQIQDVAGRTIKRLSVAVDKSWQVIRLNVRSGGAAQGVYVIRLYDKNRSIVYIRQFMITGD